MNDVPSVLRKWSVIALVVLGLAAGIGLRDPSPPDEPRFVLAASHMVESGDWLVPRRGQEYYAEKPATFMWMQAAAFVLVRDWRIAFLLPSLIAGLATLALVFDAGRRLWSPRVGWTAAGALLTCLQFGLQVKRGQIDMVLVGLTTLALWAFLRHLLERPDKRLLFLGAFAAGLGTVTKGVGFLPLLAFVPLAWLRYKRVPFHRPAVLPLVLGFVAGAAVWLGPVLGTLAVRRDPALQAYVGELLFRQTAQRYANPWHHTQPWWYYAQVVATLWLPGALLLPWLVPAWARRIRRARAPVVLLVGWSILVLLFFSLSPGKREVYVFPALPALCLAAAPFLAALLRRTVARRLLWGYLVALAIAATALALSGLTGASGWAHRLAAEREIDEASLHAFLGWLCAFGVSAMVCAVCWRRRIGMALIVTTCALWLTYGLGLAPTIEASSSARQVMQRVHARLPADAELGLVAWREQNLLQVVGRATDFGFKQPWQAQWTRAQDWVAAAPARRWLFVLDAAMSPCVDRAQAIPIGRSNRRDWWLVPGRAIRRGCSTPPLEEVAE